MKYYCIDKPVFVEESVYRGILGRIVKKLAEVEGVSSVFQVGGISSPGISDLDLVVVFRNDQACSFNLHDVLDSQERYLFIHKLFGCSQEFFQESSRFSFFHNFTLLAGAEVQKKPEYSAGEDSIIKSQIALEYLVKMFANVTLQEEYKILQLRSLLLHGKALEYDLGFLGIVSGTLKNSVHELLEIRASWFRNKSSVNNLKGWFEQFCKIYPEALRSLLSEHKLFLPEDHEYKIAKNIILKKSGILSMTRKGTLLPAFPSLFLGKRYFRLQNRFNSFILNVPFNHTSPPLNINAYFDFIRRHREYNRKYLPHFYPLTSSLLS